MKSVILTINPGVLAKNPKSLFGFLKRALSSLKIVNFEQFEKASLQM